MFRAGYQSHRGEREKERQEKPRKERESERQRKRKRTYKSTAPERGASNEKKKKN